MRYFITVIILFSLLFSLSLKSDSIKKISDIALPNDYRRVAVKRGSFKGYLRNLSLYEKGTEVLLFDGSLKGNQSAHYAVIRMSIGRRNLQQCADAVMRLRAEYFFKKRQYHKIVFNFTSGHAIPFVKWARGYRVRIKGNRVYWIHGGRRGYTRKNLMAYLRIIYSYAGTLSLEREMRRQPMDRMKIGDVFIKGGSPGHAVIVVDMAYHKFTGKKIFMLAQSYMPAQNIHVLKNPLNRRLSPWYKLDFRGKLYTPEWTFEKKHLRRF